MRSGVQVERTTGKETAAVDVAVTISTARVTSSIENLHRLSSISMLDFLARQSAHQSDITVKRLAATCTSITTTRTEDVGIASVRR